MRPLFAAVIAILIGAAVAVYSLELGHDRRSAVRSGAAHPAARTIDGAVARVPHRSTSADGRASKAVQSGAAVVRDGRAHHSSATSIAHAGGAERSHGAGTGESAGAGTLGAGTLGASAAGAGAARAGTKGASGAGAQGRSASAALVEPRDPEEARSFPAPPSVHHKPAGAPSVAAEAVIARGAASDAEIRKELAEVRAVERAASEPAHLATVPGGDSIAGSGKIPIPTDVPEVVARVIAGANAIADFPYVYGGGHASFVDTSYDCSGSVSYALAAGGLLSAPETSGELESWGAQGPGKWITVYANAGHTYMYVNVGGAWMLYDTAGRSGVFASRWQPYPVDNSGYVVRHWPGL